jgi:hypothetical protein
VNPVLQKAIVMPATPIQRAIRLKVYANAKEDILHCSTLVSLVSITLSCTLTENFLVRLLNLYGISTRVYFAVSNELS